MALTPKVYRDAEIGLLGSLLIDAHSCAAEIMLAAVPEDFASPDCRTVFEAAKNLFSDEEPIDPITVCARAGEAYRSFVREIETVTPTAAHWKGYLDALLRQSRLYRVQLLAQEITTAAAQETDPEQLLPQAETLMNILANEGGRKRAYSMGELISGFLLRQGKERDYLDWGFPNLNRHLFCGAGSYVLLAARPSVGKTALALQLGIHFAKRGKKVDFFSYETDAEKASDRIMSAQSLVSFRAINCGKLEISDYRNLAAANKQLQGIPFTLIEASGLTAADIRARTLRDGADVVIIDYLQLIDHRNQRLSEYERVTDVSRTLQKLCKRCGVTIIALSQLSRIENNAEPSLVHLRSSGQLEQDADAVMFLYCPPFDPTEGEAERKDVKNRRVLKIAKNKNGVIGKIKMWFNGNIQTFYEQWDHFYEKPMVPADDTVLGLADPEQRHQLSISE